MIHKSTRYSLSAAAGLLAVGLLAAGLAGSAGATETCQGTFAAELLHPLPAPVVAGLDIHDQSPDHSQLGERFLAGMRSAGVDVGPRPNVLLSITSSRLGIPPDQPDSRAEQDATPPSGLQGGVQQSLPAMPETRIGTTVSPPSPPTAIYRVEAKEPSAAEISWVANVQCQMLGTDDGAAAEDLGRVIGGALGKRIERGPF
jgi:hypothetical protein